MPYNEVVVKFFKIKTYNSDKLIFMNYQHSKTVPK